MQPINITLNGTESTMSGGLTAAASLYEEAGLNPKAARLYLNHADDIDTPLSPEDHVFLCGGEVVVAGDLEPAMGENPTPRKPVEIVLNGESHAAFRTAKVLADQIRRLDTALESASLFLDVDGGVDVLIAADAMLVLQPGLRFLTIPPLSEEAVDVERCGKHDRRPPKGQRRYKIRLDGEKYTVELQSMTGAEILRLAGKTYEEWTLNQKMRGGRRNPISAEQAVDFTQPGVERFESVRKQAQQGG